MTSLPHRDPRPVAKAIRLAHLVFASPDLHRHEAFLNDFGLTTAQRTADALHMRPSDGSPVCCVVERARRPAFVGVAFDVGSHDELEALSKLPGARRIEAFGSPQPAEGVRLTDPCGFRVDAMMGSPFASPGSHRAPLPINTPSEEVRVNLAQRPSLSSPDITKLGHVALEVPHFADTCAWYAHHFGLIPSDVQVFPDGSPAVCFMRLDRGETPTDHHTLAVVQGFKADLGHCAYEVVDADAVAMGQRFLRERGWRHAWGMGRHILGSQVFDYWNDPWGWKYEHYCDGDVFTSEHPMGVHALGRDAMSQWGPPMPRSFTRPALSVANVRALVRNLRTSRDVTARKLFQLLREFG